MHNLLCIMLPPTGNVRRCAIITWTTDDYVQALDGADYAEIMLTLLKDP